MLQTLRIRNLALLDEVCLDFDKGFTAVTGETGAGKSILLGALSLLAGGRAEKTIIRQGADACEVEASLHFADPSGVDALLGGIDLPPCEDGTLILRRSIPREKPPRISVNGRLTTLAALQRLGEFWIDFHGPSEPRRLLRDACQLELLDLFARSADDLAAYQADYGRWRELIVERDRVTAAARLSPDQVAFLEKQISDLEQLDLNDEATQALERDCQRISRSQELGDLTASLSNGLAGDDGIEGRVAALLRTAKQLEGLDPECKAIADRLCSVAVEINDLASECASLGREVQFSEEEAADLQRRMDVWLAAKRRHGGSAQSVLRALEEMRRQLALQGNLDETLETLDAAISAARKAALEKAGKLRVRREKASRKLASAAAKDIASLGFKRAELRIRLASLQELGPTGDCQCEILFSPNPGEPPLPLRNIASSGELARVMLGLKAVLAEIDAVPVLVFDEVDANVGGEIGSVVGERMAAIAGNHQVLCVTHLPQVAARADNHFLVEKLQTADRTSVRIGAVHGDRDVRIAELARMLGDRNAASARAHAKELLKTASGRAG